MIGFCIESQPLEVKTLQGVKETDEEEGREECFNILHNFIEINN